MADNHPNGACCTKEENADPQLTIHTAASRADALAMGCCASKKAGDPGPPPHLQAATARTVRLLESLAAKEERVEQPNSKRLRSGQRGMTRALLFGVKGFFEQRGALDKTMQDISSASTGSSSARAS